MSEIQLPGLSSATSALPVSQQSCLSKAICLVAGREIKMHVLPALLVVAEWRTVWSSLHIFEPGVFPKFRGTAAMAVLLSIVGSAFAAQGSLTLKNLKSALSRVSKL